MNPTKRLLILRQGILGEEGLKLNQRSACPPIRHPQIMQVNGINTFNAAVQVSLNGMQLG